MEKLYLEVPSIERKNQALEYIKEFYEYNSQINGVGGLDKKIEKGISYEEWVNENLKMSDKNYAYSKGLVPGETFFLIRKEDDKLIGMINLRYELNDYLRNFGGHIGYSIRPTERRKGYNKINLYLCLLEAQKHDLEKVLITCADYNEGSRKSIKALDGEFEKINYDESDEENMELYWINVNKTINKYKDVYEQYIIKSNKTR